MVFHDHADIEGLGQRAELRQAIGREFGLLLTGPGAVGVHPDAVAAEEFGGFQPFYVVFHGLFTFGFIRVAEIALAVTHNEHPGHTMVVGAFFEAFEVFLVGGLVHPELVDVFHAADAEIALRDEREIEVIQLAGKKGEVQRPAGEGDFEGRGRRFLGEGPAREGQGRGGGEGRAEKRTA